MRSRNVAALSRSPRAPRREGRTLTPAQAHQLLHALKGHRHEALYALMLSTGLRKGEALGLQWKDFDESLGVISVRRQLKWEGGVLITSDTKTSRSRRTVNLPAPMIAALKAHSARQAADRLAMGGAWHATEFIFTSKVGTPMDPRNLHREFRDICRGAGLGGLASTRITSLRRQPHARSRGEVTGRQRSPGSRVDPHDRRRLRPHPGSRPSGGGRRHGCRALVRGLLIDFWGPTSSFRYQALETRTGFLHVSTTSTNDLRVEEIHLFPRFVIWIPPTEVVQLVTLDQIRSLAQDDGKHRGPVSGPFAPKMNSATATNVT